jgi:hypothetical protein
MKVLTRHEPFLIEFTREELSRIEEALTEARALEYRQAQQLLEKTQLGVRLDPRTFVADLDTVLAGLDQLELWDDEPDGGWDDWDDEDESAGPELPCHLMPAPAPRQV